jgi:hypothetical protein
MPSVVRSALLPLFLIWLMLHAALLGLVLAAKFLGAKSTILVLLMVGVVWFLLRPQPSRLMPPRRVMV